MELDITRFIEAHADCMERFSDSIAHSGLVNIGAITWRNACNAMADESAWLCPNLDALREHFAEYGAWEREELARMSGVELNALLVQFIASDWQERRRSSDPHAGRFYQGDAGSWHYYVGG